MVQDHKSLMKGRGQNLKKADAKLYDFAMSVSKKIKNK